MFRFLATLVSLIAALSLCVGQAEATEFILNGSFESPSPDATWLSFYGGKYTFSATNWQNTRTSGVWRPDIPSTPATLSDVPDGQQVGFANSGNSLYQDTAAKLTAGVTYTLQAYVGCRYDYIGTGSVALETTAGDVLAGSGTVAPAYGQFQFVVFTYTPETDNPCLGENLRVRLQCGSFGQASFDKVSLTAVPGPRVSLNY